MYLDIKPVLLMMLLFLKFLFCLVLESSLEYIEENPLKEINIKKTIDMLRDKYNRSDLKDHLLVVKISGTTMGGKTSFVNSFKKILEKQCPYKYNYHTISADDYYESRKTGNDKVELSNYVYDSPRCFMFEKLKNHIVDVANGKEIYNSYKFSFETMKSKKIENKNPLPKNEKLDILIIEGLYLDQVFEKECQDTSELCQWTNISKRKDHKQDGKESTQKWKWDSIFYERNTWMYPRKNIMKKNDLFKKLGSEIKRPIVLVKIFLNQDLGVIASKRRERDKVDKRYLANYHENMNKIIYFTELGARSILRIHDGQTNFGNNILVNYGNMESREISKVMKLLFEILFLIRNNPKNGKDDQKKKEIVNIIEQEIEYVKNQAFVTNAKEMREKYGKMLYPASKEVVDFLFLETKYYSEDFEEKLKTLSPGLNELKKTASADIMARWEKIKEKYTVSEEGNNGNSIKKMPSIMVNWILSDLIRYKDDLWKKIKEFEKEIFKKVSDEETKLVSKAKEIVYSIINILNLEGIPEITTVEDVKLIVFVGDYLQDFDRFKENTSAVSRK